jgi:hypothetical protein
VQSIVTKIERRISDYQAVKQVGGGEEEKIKSLARLFGYREFWPSLLNMVNRSVEAVAVDQPRLTDFARYLALQKLHRRTYDDLAAGKGEELSPKDLKAAAAVLLNRTDVDPNSAALKDELAKKLKDVEDFKATERKARKVIVVESLAPTYVRNLGLAQAAAGGGLVKAAPPGARTDQGFKVEMVARTPLPRIEANRMVADLRAYSVALSRWLSSLSVDQHEVAWLPMTAEAVGYKRSAVGAPGAARIPDPLMPDDPNEDMAQDTRFKVTWWVAIEGDGIVTADVKLGRRYKLSGDLELMPEFDPADALAAAKGIQTLKAGTIIALGQDPNSDMRMRGTTPWYQVKAADASGKELSGWVSGAALDKQKLEAVATGP